MTKVYLFLLLCIASFQACSQTPTTTKETPKPVITETPKAAPVYASAKAGWLVDLDEAYAISSKTGKPILANFTGSDWCGWCKRLDADVFSKPEFQNWAKKNVVLLELDFPRRFQIPQKNQQQNAAMQQALQIRGYPTISVLNLQKDPSGKYNIEVLGQTGYTPTVEQFIGTVEKMVNP
jgi:thiol-disulfide isomerase/thioredoxin